MNIDEKTFFTQHADYTLLTLKQMCDDGDIIKKANDSYYRTRYYCSSK